MVLLPKLFCPDVDQAAAAALLRLFLTHGASLPKPWETAGEKEQLLIIKKCTRTF